MFHLGWTNLRYRLLRTLVAVLSITVGIWLAMILRGVSEGTLQRSLDEMRSMDRYLMVRAPGPIFRMSQNPISYEPEMIKRLSAEPGIESAVPFRYFMQQLTAERLGLVAAFPIASFRDAEELFPVSEGRSIQGPGETLIEYGMADFLGVKVGDDITLPGLGTFKLAGLITNRTQLIPVQILFDLETVAKAINDSRIHGIFIKAGDLNDVAKLQTTIPTKFPEVIADPIQLVAESVGKALDRFDQFVQLIFWLSITVSAVISGLVLLSMVGEQRRDLGILKAMGASDSAVISLILSQALVLGLSGAGLGAFFAWVMKVTLLPHFFPSIHMDFSLQWFMEAIGAGLGAGFLGALGATAYALKVDPVEVLTYE